MTDPTTAGESVEVWGQDIVSLGSEHFELKRVTIPLEECCLVHHQTSAALRMRTSLHKDFGLCGILGPKARGNLNGKELSAHTMTIATPGAKGDTMVNPGYESVALLVPVAFLHKQLALRGFREGFSVTDNPEVWHPAVEVASDLFKLGVRISKAAEKTPWVFNENHWARYGAQVEYMDALCAAIESCKPDEYVGRDRKGRSYSQIVRACEDYTLSLGGRRPYLSELCEAACVSERTLQYAFQDIMGLSPLTYLHRLRLHRARDELRMAKVGSTTVSEVAMNWGFWHFGEFSRAYKNCFAETPSSTLRNNFNDSIPGIRH